MPDIYHDEYLIEMCRDLAMRTHGKFSVGSECKFHRFAIEIMTDTDSADFRVWELEHEGNGYDFRVDGGTRLRSVLFLSDLRGLNLDNVPAFARCYPEFIKRIHAMNQYPRYIRMWVKLDFEGKIWNKPKVYVRDMILSSYSLDHICGPDVQDYIHGVFDWNYFKDFRRMKV